MSTLFFSVELLHMYSLFILCYLSTLTLYVFFVYVLGDIFLFYTRIYRSSADQISSLCTSLFVPRPSLRTSATGTSLYVSLHPYFHSQVHLVTLIRLVRLCICRRLSF
jgi:hypothetical protein